jgi:hypothetical protein
MSPYMNQLCRLHDVILLVLYWLRFDVADEQWHMGGTPNLRGPFPAGWEERHSPS